ncbi:LamG-like jellyroll fold domain-containing protein [Micromonospora sp. NPDC047670]|uniref:LamG-like jellyroll fold domain-containing protein n=1 Tax=Micromonospora sp. NPDC047670 TaxID=3364252 RepID=UPI0037133B2C
MVTAVAVSVAAIGVAGTPVSPAAAAPACDAVKSSEREALTAAAACDRPVVVGPSRSEYVQVVAQPDGRLRFESAVEPQRTRRPDGSWAEVDLTLRRGADGLLRPAASVADVAFSGGGDAPMVSLRRGGKSMSLSWPQRLPAPTVSGDSATYPGVLPEVDLVVRATRTGFTHVLVVRSARAAANPAVRSITLRAGGDADLTRLPDGALRAAVGGAPFARAERAVMWDSSLPAGARVARGQDAPIARSSASVTGDGARTAAVATQVTREGDLRLVPDAKLLDAPGTTFPVYVDPNWSVTRSKWAYGTSNGCTNTDYTVARVGLSPDGPCNDVRFRSYFQFPTSNGSVSLKGKHIESAYVQMSLYHSWSCGATYTNMYLTPVINATMKASYTGMALKSYLTRTAGNANKGYGCSDSPQPDMTMNFSASAVTSQVQTAAANSWNTITFGFSARDSDGTDESTQDRWKKFTPGKAKLVVDYDSRPGRATGMQVAGVACPTSGVMTTGTLTPTFSAVYPDADTTQSLNGVYEWIEVPAGGIGTVTDSFPARLTPPNRPSAPANGRATTSAVTVVKGKTYAWRVTTVDPAPYSQWSGWSGWCQFRADNTAPAVTVTVVTAPTGPGHPAKFRIDSPSADVTTFRYGWTGATTAIAPTGTGPKSAELTLTVPRYGTNILYVSAVDATLNEGYASVEVDAKRPSPPIARWGLETYPGQTQAGALADTQPALGDSDGTGPLVNDTSLTGSNVAWAGDARLLGGQSASFNGLSSWLTTAAPVLDTRKSFSVAAWVRLGDTSTYRTVVSQMGTKNARFILYFDPSANAGAGGWGFFMYNDPDAAVNAGDVAYSGPATVNRWTHLAGVYDATARTISLYVDGVRVKTVGHTVSKNATGPVNIGRKLFDGVSHHLFKGEIADVQIFDRVVVEQDFTGQLKSDEDSSGFDEPGMLAPVQVGGWDFNGGVSCHAKDRAGACEAPDGTGFDRWLALERGAEVTDTGLHLDGYYFPDVNPEPWEATAEWARSAVKTGTSVDGDGEPTTVWQNTPVLRTDQSFTVSAWTKLDRTDAYQMVLSQEGTVNSGFYLYFATDDGGVWKLKMQKDAATADGGTGTTFAQTPALDAGESWHHLVGVLDAGRRQLRLYVDGDLKTTSTLNAAWQPWQASGPLKVGRGYGTSHPLFGAVDDIGAYQGAMTDAQVKALYDDEVVKAPEL